MTNVVIWVEGGLVQAVYTRNKNIRVEVLDMDFEGGDEEQEREYCAKERRLEQIKASTTYKCIY